MPHSFLSHYESFWDYLGSQYVSTGPLFSFRRLMKQLPDLLITTSGCKFALDSRFNLVRRKTNTYFSNLVCAIKSSVYIIIQRSSFLHTRVSLAQHWLLNVPIYSVPGMKIILHMMLRRHHPIIQAPRNKLRCFLHWVDGSGCIGHFYQLLWVPKAFNRRTEDLFSFLHCSLSIFALDTFINLWGYIPEIPVITPWQWHA